MALSPKPLGSWSSGLRVQGPELAYFLIPKPEPSQNCGSLQGVQGFGFRVGDLGFRVGVSGFGV